MTCLKINVKRIEGGKLPVYKREGDVCLDCYARLARDKITIPRGERCLVNLGFALELPAGWEAVIRPRSGSTFMGIDVGIGTIDTNYRGEVKVCIINNSKLGDCIVENGDRVCQLAIREAPVIAWEEVDELSETVRGDKGFGSSGK